MLARSAADKICAMGVLTDAEMDVIRFEAGKLDQDPLQGRRCHPHGL
jgi:hypothetical protein